MTKQPKTALITGITGQDASYLAEFLYGDLTDSSHLGAQSHVAGMGTACSSAPEPVVVHLSL